MFSKTEMWLFFALMSKFAILWLPKFSLAKYNIIYYNRVTLAL
jgi:hypothetical protein